MFGQKLSGARKRYISSSCHSIKKPLVQSDKAKQMKLNFVGFFFSHKININHITIYKLLFWSIWPFEY